MALPIYNSRSAIREDGFIHEILPGSLPPRPKAGKAIEPKIWKPGQYCSWEWLGVGKADRKSTRLNSSHSDRSRMPSSA